MPLLHLKASGLIKAEQAFRDKNPDSSEALREGAVIDNQALLIAAYQRATSGSDLPIVFDGHSLIDGKDGLVEIPAEVFAELDLDAICYLKADPELIFERRQGDVGRERPIRNSATLRRHQTLAEAAARRIAVNIASKFIVLEDGQKDHILNVIANELR